jgi:hypothetical protein
MVKQERNEVCDHLVELIMLFEGFLSLSSNTCKPLREESHLPLRRTKSVVIIKIIVIKINEYPRSWRDRLDYVYLHFN